VRLSPSLPSQALGEVVLLLSGIQVVRGNDSDRFAALDQDVFPHAGRAPRRHSRVDAARSPIYCPN